jgi:choline kinase
MVKKAIITAAGLGSRLGALTADKPKCLLKVGHKTILEHAKDALVSGGVQKIVLVRGYHGKKINSPGFIYYDNHDYLQNNILESLFCAREEIDGEFIFSYSDIVYNKEIVKALVKAKGDAVIVIDTEWRKIYEGRELHPETEAELTEVASGKVSRVGKGVVSAKKAKGEFIGLAKFSSIGAKILRSEFERLERLYKASNAPFQHAKNFRQAYFTDMLQELIGRRYEIRPLYMQGGWRESDTAEDLARAQEFFKSPECKSNT